MAYNAFTIDKVQKDFGITISNQQPIFEQVVPVPPGERLTAVLQRYVSLGSQMLGYPAQGQTSAIELCR